MTGTLTAAGASVRTALLLAGLVGVALIIHALLVRSTIRCESSTAMDTDAPVLNSAA